MLTRATRIDSEGLRPTIAASSASIAILSTLEGRRQMSGSRVLHCVDWQGHTMWRRLLGAGAEGPRIGADGTIWIALKADIIGLDTGGEVVRRIACGVSGNEHVGAFLPIAGGFLVTVLRSAPRAQARVARLGEAGEQLWSTDTTPDAIQYFGIQQHSIETGWRPRPMPAWTPETWTPVHHSPLVLSARCVLAGFHEFPRSGVGQRFLLNAETGEVTWTGPPAPCTYAAISGPNEFLVGEQGYGTFATHLVTSSGTIDRWVSSGHYMVTGDQRRVVEVNNASDFQHLAELLPGGQLRDTTTLPGFHTSGPLALADGSVIMWRNGKILLVEPGGSLITLREFGDPNAGCGRMVTNGEGAIAFALSDGEHGHGSWPV